MALKKLKCFISVLFCICLCCAQAVLPVHAEGSDIPESCGVFDLACKAIRDARAMGRITDSQMQTIWDNCEQNGWYKFGVIMGMPEAAMGDQSSLDNQIRHSFSNFMNGVLDQYYGTDFNLKGCLFFGGKYCQIHPSQNNFNFDSGYRNYYVGGKKEGDRIVNKQGDTKNFRIVNTSNKTLNYYKTDITSNYYNINNYITNNYNSYYYDIHNETYNFSMVDNSTTTITNNYNNSVVNVININGSSQSYAYYFQTPSGSNSFNLKPEDLKGVSLDYHVKNYDLSYDDNGQLLGLYHFENSLDNDANSDFLVNFSPQSLNYVENDQKQFGNALIFNTSGDLSINFSKPATVYDFRFKVVTGKDFKLFIPGCVSPSDGKILPIIWRLLDTTKTVKYETKTTVTDHVTYANRTGSVVTCGSGVAQGVSSLPSQNGIPMYSWTCKFTDKVTQTQEVPVTSSTTEWKTLAGGKLVNFSVWNHLLVTPDEIYINGTPVTKNVYGKYVKRLADDMRGFKVSGDSTFIIDELRVVSGGEIPSSNSIILPSSPYDGNFAFTLPDVDENHTILVQSRIPVASTQWGGKRKSNPKLGDIYAYIDDMNVCRSFQQYDGSAWREYPASFYSVKYGKWLSIVGSNLVSGKFVDQDVGGSSGGGSGASEGFLKDMFNSVLKKLDEGIGVLKNLPSSTINNYEYNQVNNYFGDNPSEKGKEIGVQLKEKVTETKKKLGILSAPFDYTEKTLKTFDHELSNSSGNYVVSFPEFKIGENTLIPAVNFDFMGVIEQSPALKSVYGYYLVFIRVLIYFGLLMMLKAKIMKILEH